MLQHDMQIYFHLHIVMRFTSHLNVAINLVQNDAVMKKKKLSRNSNTRDTHEAKASIKENVQPSKHIKNFAGLLGVT